MGGSASKNTAVENTISDIRKIATNEINELTDQKNIDIYTTMYDEESGLVKKMVNVGALNEAFDRIAITYKKELSGLNKDVLKNTAYNLGLQITQKELDKLAPSKEVLKEQIVDFYTKKFNLIRYVLDNLTIGCRDEQRIINKRFPRLIATATPEQKKELEKRLNELNGNAKDYYNKIRAQLKRLRHDIDRKTLEDINKKTREIMRLQYGQCCKSIDALRNFYWISTKQEIDGKTSKYFYNPLMKDEQGNALTSWTLPDRLSEIGGVLPIRDRKDMMCPIEPSKLEKITMSVRKRLPTASFGIGEGKKMKTQ